MLLFLLCVILGFAFPRFLINAIRAETETARSDNTLLACLCFGVITAFLLGNLS